MIIEIDAEADAASFRLAEGEVFESEFVGDSVVLDYAEDGSLLAVEFLMISKNLPKGAFATFELRPA